LLLLLLLRMLLTLDEWEPCVWTIQLGRGTSQVKFCVVLLTI
jgi:hypothetical protein